jgi:hypothetical protein
MTGDVTALRASDVYNAFNNQFGEPNPPVHMEIGPLIKKAVEDKAAGLNSLTPPDYDFEMPSLFDT